MSEPTTTAAVATVAEATRANGKDKESTQTQESAQAMQPKKPANAEPKASNGDNNANNNNNNNNNNTPPPSSATPTSASAQSPKSQKSRKSNITPRGGGAPSSPSTRASDSGKKPARSDAASALAAGAIGLGVVASAGPDASTSSNSDKVTEPQQKPPRRTSGYTSRRGRPSDSQSSSPSITPPASTSEARFANTRGGGYSGRGRDDDNIRGRKFDSRQGRAAPSERVLPPQTGAESDLSTSADTSRPLQQSHSTGFSDVRKSSGYSTRSPLSPRSPRRGFGERGMESRRTNIAVAQEGSAASSPQAETGSSTLAASHNKRKPNRKNKRPEDDDGSAATVGSTKGPESAMESKDSARNKGARDYRTNQQQSRDWKNDTTLGRQRNDARRDASETGPAVDWTSNVTKNTDKKDTDDAQNGWGDAPATTSTQPADGWGSSANVSLKWGEDLPWERSDKNDLPATKPPAASKPRVGRDAERKNGDDSQGGGNSSVEPATSNEASGWGKDEPSSMDARKGFAPTKHATATKPKTTRAPAARSNSTPGSGWGDAPTTSARTDEAGGWGQPENTNLKRGKETAGDNNDARKEAPPARAQPTSTPRAFNRNDRKDDNSTQDGWGAAPEASSSAAPANGWGAPVVTNKKWGEDLPWEKDSSSNAPVPDIAPATRSKAPSKPERREHRSAQDSWSDARVTDSVAQPSGGWGEPAVVTKKWGEDLPWEAESTTDTRGSGSASSKAAEKKDTLAPNGWGDAPAADTKSSQADGWGQPVVTTSTWGESVPWEQSSPNQQERHQERDGSDFQRRNSSQDMRDSRSNNNRQGYGDFHERSGHGQGRPPGRGGDARFKDSRPHGYQRERMQDERPTRRFQEVDSASRSQDARSSLDARNERLGFHRAPRRPDSLQQTDAPAEQASSGGWERSKPIESSWDSSKTATSPNRRRGLSPAGSGDGRFDARYGNPRTGYGRSDIAPPRRGQRNEGFPNQYGQNSRSSNARPSEKPLRESFPGRDKPDAAGQGRKVKSAKDTRAPKPPGQTLAPMFSDSLECQMTWEEMDLRPNVLESIAKASLPKPSNIQKLVMKPFKEGRDVIAQSQSQKDRTNTLAIALLQKLTPAALTQKHCKAVMICSEGINPQRVHEDLQGWFETTPGLSSILLSSDSTAEKQKSVLSDPEQAKQVVITTLGPLMDVLRNDLLDMKQVDTVVISMRSDELVNFDAFKQFWAMLPREAQVILMTGRIQPQIQLIKTHHFRADAAVRRADELTMQWSEHYYVSIPSQRQHRKQRGGEKGQDRDQSKDENEDPSESDQATTAPQTRDEKWEVLMEILDKNPDISHIVILTLSQSSTQSLTTKLEEQNQPVLSVWSMADKTDVARQFNRPERCILVSESILMENLDLDHSSLVINYEMPRKAWHYISSFGPFGRSGLRTLMINFCVTDDPAQKQTLETMETLYDIKIQEMKV
ncbi:translation initiation factor eIF4A [Mortierella alpina]|nr:translation initiation factor eIF4A [Mortierella alpina]